MKNTLKKAALVVMILALSLGLMVGCGGGADDPAEEGASSGGSMNLTIVGGSIGGAWASIGEGVGEVIRRSNDSAVVAYEVGQEAANIALVSTGSVQLGIAHSSLINMAANGEAPFNTPLTNLKALTVLYGEAAQHFVIKTDTGITSFQDIADQQYPLAMNLNTVDSFMEIVGKACLEANGISYDDLAAWGGSVDYMSMGSSFDLMRDGKIEAYSNVMQYPSSHIIDASTTLDLTLLPMSEEAIETVNAQLGTVRTVIPKDQYPFLTEDVPTVAATVVLFASDDLSDEEAYNIVKSIDENLEYFTGIHSSVSGLNLETMQEVGPIEIHPGAVKYYQENAQ